MSYTVYHPAFLDCQAEATGVHAAGTTTWTFTTPRPYTLALYKPTGEAITLTTADNLNFTKSGDYSGGAAILGIGYEATAILSEPILREDNGQPEVGGQFAIRAAYLTFTDTVKCDLYWQRLTSADAVGDSGLTTYLNEDGVGGFGIPRFKTALLWVMGNAEDTDVRIVSPKTYPYPVTVTGVQYEGNIVMVPR